jgi:DNA modification methylase
MLPINSIYHDDVLDGLSKIDDGVIDLTVTSPPYDNLRKYKDLDWGEHIWKPVIKVKNSLLFTVYFI